MQVILLERMKNLGHLGDKVTVKPGYGRNYLIPQKKAVFATEKNIASFEKMRKELEKKAKEVLLQAQKQAEVLEKLTLVISTEASDEGKLYGSVGVNEINAAIKEQGIEISKRFIVIPNGVIHSLGEYEVELHIHTDVVARVKLQVNSNK